MTQRPKWLGSVLAAFGLGSRPHAPPTPLDPRTHWMRQCGCDLVLDVGANAGQYAQMVRRLGWNGPLMSFEPLPDAWRELIALHGADPLWKGFNCALGDTPGEFQIQVAGNSQSSSLLPMMASHIQALPESAPTGVMETVLVRRLDEVLATEAVSARSIYLKIDTQGFEMPVVLGAGADIGRVAVLELEMSLVPLYENQVLMHDAWKSLLDLGFEPVWLDRGFSTADGMHVLQIDAMFRRRPG